MLMKAAGKDCTALFSIRIISLFLHCDSLSCKLVWHINSYHYDAFAAFSPQISW
jgi:hypothetical protein